MCRVAELHNFVPTDAFRAWSFDFKLWIACVTWPLGSLTGPYRCVPSSFGWHVPIDRLTVLNVHAHEPFFFSQRSGLTSCHHDSR